MTTSQTIGVEPDGRIPRDTHRCTRNILADSIVEIQPWSEICTVVMPEGLDGSGAAAAPLDQFLLPAGPYFRILVRQFDERITIDHEPAEAVAAQELIQRRNRIPMEVWKCQEVVPCQGRDHPVAQQSSPFQEFRTPAIDGPVGNANNEQPFIAQNAPRRRKGGIGIGQLIEGIPNHDGVD